MSTHTQILYQIVFGTKRHEMTLISERRKRLYMYISGILRNKKCRLYGINGTENHLHIVTHLHPSVRLADLVKDIKLASSEFIKATMLFPDFMGWQDGYGAFTYSIDSKDNLINYLKNQEEIHREKTYREEYIELLREHSVEFDEKYLV